MPSVGVVVFTLHGMQNIERCVESVGWADTVQLCPLDEEGSGDLVSQDEPTEWVLYLFGEEEVDVELSSAIQDALGSEKSPLPGAYSVQIRSRLLDHWISASCWEPVPSPRLLRTTAARAFAGWKRADAGRRNQLVLPGWVSDHSFEVIANGMQHLNVLSGTWARTQQGPPHGLRELVNLPAWVFSWLLLRRGLWLRGLPGFSLAVIAAYTCMATEMKCWELGLARMDGPPPGP